MVNWERKFRQLKRVELTDDDRYDFGTVGGLRTIAELRDLVAAHSYSIAQIQKAININAATLAQHPQEYIRLINDWNVLLARWNAAKSVAMKALNTWHSLPDNLTPAESEYVVLLKSIQMSYPELRTSPGDLVDVVSQLRKLQVSPDLSQMPQPRAGTDADINVLKASDTLLEAAKPTRGTWIKLGAGALAALVVLKKLGLL